MAEDGCGNSIGVGDAARALVRRSCGWRRARQRCGCGSTRTRRQEIGPRVRFCVGFEVGEQRLEQRRCDLRRVQVARPRVARRARADDDDVRVGRAVAKLEAARDPSVDGRMYARSIE